MFNQYMNYDRILLFYLRGKQLIKYIICSSINENSEEEETATETPIDANSGVPSSWLRPLPPQNPYTDYHYNPSLQPVLKPIHFPDYQNSEEEDKETATEAPININFSHPSKTSGIPSSWLRSMAAQYPYNGYHYNPGFRPVVQRPLPFPYNQRPIIFPDYINRDGNRHYPNFNGFFNYN